MGKPNMGCFPHFFQAGAQLKQSRQQILNRQSRDHFQVFPLIAGKCGVGQAQRIGTDVHGFLGAVLLEPKHRSAQFKQEKEAGRTPAFR
jgi:hypothetical protein